MSYLPRLFCLVLICLLPASLQADEWRTEKISVTDLKFMSDLRERIDDLSRRNFGRQLNGNRANDIAVMQRLLDEQVVTSDQVPNLQAKGVVLGELLKEEQGLSWVVYIDKYGRSRALQVPGFEKEFIFPVTQVSRKAEVGIKVNISEVYADLEKAVADIRKLPPF
jgi:hypothetical protein